MQAYFLNAYKSNVKLDENLWKNSHLKNFPLQYSTYNCIRSIYKIEWRRYGKKSSLLYSKIFFNFATSSPKKYNRICVDAALCRIPLDHNGIAWDFGDMLYGLKNNLSKLFHRWFSLQNTFQQKF
jgi:hypothetical protein